MQMWQGIIATFVVVIVALLVYDRWVRKAV